MCGIVGFITEEKFLGRQSRESYLEQALIVDTIRGPHSTGVLTVTREKNEAGYLKVAANGCDFVERQDYKDLTKKIENYRAMIGHNRFATMGSVNSKNAHPFMADNITLVHNGTLNDPYSLPTGLHELDTIEVDSEALCYNLALHSVEDVIKSIDGAFALVWHDKKDGSINIIRNSQRPLHMAMCTSQKTLLIASEADMLRLLVKRGHINIGDVATPKPGRLFKFKDDLTKPEIKELALHVPKTYNYPTHYYNRGGNSYSYNTKKTLINSRLVEVPDLCKEALSKNFLSIEGKIYAIPMNIMTIKGPKDKCIVTAHCSSRDITCMFYNVTPYMAKNNFDYEWQVRPLAIRYIGNEKVVICDVLNFNATTCPRSTELTNYKDKSDDVPVIDGPDGVATLTVTEFMELTKDGCAWCTEELSIMESDSIVWTEMGLDNKEKMPICAECASILDEDTKNALIIAS